MQQPFLTILIPCFNEARRLPATLGEVLSYLSQQSDSWEIIVVDDGSTDGAAAVVAPYLVDQRVRLCSLPTNRGKGAAIQAGIELAQGRFILFTDADASTPITELPKLQAAIASGADVTIGSRSVRRAVVARTQPLHCVLIGKFGNWVIRSLLGLPFRDTQCGFKLFRAEAAKQLFLALRFLRWSFDFEVLLRASKQGMHVIEVPVLWEHRGDSKFSPLKDAARCFLEVLLLRMSYVRWFEVGLLALIIGGQTLMFVLFRSMTFVNWDAAQFGLGTVHFDLAMHQPHPPGYPLFVALGSVLQALLGDANVALSLLSFVATLIATVSLWRIGRCQSLGTAVAMSLLFATNPVVLFVQGSALTYAFDAMVVSVLLILLQRAKSNGNSTLFGAVFVAAAIGLRPSVVLAAVPLLFWLWWLERPTVRRTIETVGLAMVVLASWFFPFALAAGGLSVVWQQTIVQFTNVRLTPVHDLNASWFLVSSFVYASLFLSVLAGMTFVFRKGTRSMVGAMASLVLSLFFFGGVHFGETGYLMAVLPLLLFLAHPTIAVFASWRFGQALLAVIVIAQLSLFAGVASPWLPSKVQQMSAPAVARHDAAFATTLATLRQMDPATTLVVVRRGTYVDERGEIRSHVYDDIRALEYHLPAYRLYDVVGVPGVYGVAWQHYYQRKEAKTMYFPSAYTTLAIVTDGLASDDLPDGLTVTRVGEMAQPGSVFTAPLDGRNSFSLFGFHMQRSGSYD